ncbi:hypothetical protein OEW28_09595 [Defluviimonas sp. WL0002]|uniref:Lipoprotein n=1 Tax=Albidovulum marisflavi TaxID=2984159 RepID=A0ABT2ZCR5_9RHOB|nr:hypothetical protein [Defluviimonas sp. WL0002]MCV2868881.1 hypothetical protein [Defluviimonas sp. WL0002]
MRASGTAILALGAVVMMSGCVQDTAAQAQRAQLRLPEQPAQTPGVRQVSAAAPRNFPIYLTGYTYWDNTPPGSAAIARPVVHRRAGGSGTWADPVTIAVGHRIDNGRQSLDYPAGTRFYLPRLRKYAIVEDVCGDGAKPQDGPCHTGHRGHPWLDIWIGGRGQSQEASDLCARRITAVQQAIINPPRDLPVEVGEIAAEGCRVFG